MQGSILPYRTTAEELVAWVHARARGRSVGQLRQGAAPKSAEGVAQTATQLGLAAEGELTPEGQGLALADPAERRVRLRAALAGFPPYRALLEAARDGGHPSLETSWIEAWWATRGWGSSPSNRLEGSATFGRLVEEVGLGRYVAGRRGHPTRVEWDLAAVAGVLEAPAGEGGAKPGPVTAPAGAPAATNRVEVRLEGGRSARLELPSALPRGEKRRLLELVDLLVAEE